MGGHRRRQVAGAGLVEQLADRRLVLLVVALAELGVADLAVGVDQVLGRPVLVLVGVPGPVAVVLDDRVARARRTGSPADVAGLLLEGELGRLDADDVQPVAVVGGVQALEERQRADAVDAGVGPEVDQHHVAAQAGQVSGRSPGVLNHCWVSVKSGAGPRSGSDGRLDAGDRDARPASAPAWPSASLSGAAANRDAGRSEASRFWTALEFSSARVGSTRKAGQAACPWPAPPRSARRGWWPSPRR